jgi:hypothetical protein
MAVRNESVRLDVDGNFTTAMARNAASVALLNRELDTLDGRSVKASTSTGSLERQIVQTTRSIDDGGNSIDKYSGRLSILAQAASVFVPTLAPLGASTVPIISALTAGLGAAAGALGVTLLASNGLGDALEALNAQQLEPSRDNMQALRAELEKIGPAGEQFVRYLDSLGPELTSVQMIARAGLFPGVEDGIDGILTRLPQMRGMVSGISRELGDLAADAGDALASDRYDAFFDYLETEAGPILSDFGRITGNIFETVANLIVALDPATQDFTSGLLDRTRDLAEWSRELGQDRGFQAFLDYIEESGPKALEFVATLTTSLADIAEAMAPVGDVVLPALTQVVEVIGTIASSDFGTPILAGVAALSVYNRTLKVTAALQARLAMSGTLGGLGSMVGVRGLDAGTASTKASIPTMREFGTVARFAGQSAGYASAETLKARTSVRLYGRAAFGATAPIAGLALAGTGAADGIGMSNTASLALLGTLGGPWGVALGAAAGMTLDLAHANDSLNAAINGVNDAIETGASVAILRQQREALRAEVEATQQAMAPPSITNPLRFSAFGLIRDTIRRDGLEAASATEEAVGRVIAARRRLEALDTVDPLDGLNHFFGELNGEVLEATSLMYGFGDAVGRANGFLDDRAALASYEAAIDAVKRSLEDNGRTLDVNTAKGRNNLRTLDNIAASGLRLAETMKGQGRKNYLDELRGSLRAAATQMGYSKMEAREYLDELGLIDKKKVEPDLRLQTDDFDERQRQVVRVLERLDLDGANPFVQLRIAEFLNGRDQALTELRMLGRQNAKPSADLDLNPLTAALGVARSKLHDLDGDRAVVTIETRHINTFSGRQAGNDPSAPLATPQRRAGGGLIRGPGGPRDDLIPVMASNREYFVQAAAVEHYGVDFFDRANAMMLAKGGPTDRYALAAGGSVVGVAPASTSLRDAGLMG